MIYLDNSATTKPLPQVLETFVKANEQYYANPASLHEMGVQAERLLESSREQIARILHAKAQNVYFTSGGTESNNMAIFGLAKGNRNRGNHIITSKIEHPSVLESFKQLELEGFQADYLDVNKFGEISLEELKDKLRPDTIFVSIMHVNNEIGTVQPIEEIAKIIHEESRAIFHVDAVQSFGKLPISFEGEGPDAITVSGHKINGLKGTGVLVTRKSFKMQPLLLGGGQESGLRSGTVSVPHAASLAKAMRLAAERNNAQTFLGWKNELIMFLEQFSFVKVITPKNSAPHILSIAIEGIKGEVVVNALQHDGVIVSTSSACSSKNQKLSHVIEAIKLSEDYKRGVIRISFGLYVTKEDIEDLKKYFTAAMQTIKGDTFR